MQSDFTDIPERLASVPRGESQPSLHRNNRSERRRKEAAARTLKAQADRVTQERLRQQRAMLRQVQRGGR